MNMLNEFAPIFILLNLLISLIASQDNSSENKTKPKGLVPQLDKLPEPFSNQKLLHSSKDYNVCYALLGCFERLPYATPLNDPEELTARFKIFTREQPRGTPIFFEHSINCVRDSCAIYPFNLSLLLESKFNMNLRTIIVIPGYRSKLDEAWPLEIMDQWLRLDNVNVIVVSWPGGNHGLYDSALVNSKIVGRQITVLLYYLAILSGHDLNEKNFLDQIYLVGHSLGAHIASFVGDDFGGKIGRIIGLDPAGPLFDTFAKKFKLDKTDAQLVDVLHTNGGKWSPIQPYFGLEEPIGHIDYYANDGKHQVSCVHNVLGCSHKIVVRFYMSVLEHELINRQILSEKHWLAHRIFAYFSENFQSFHNGTIFTELCPQTAFDHNLSFKDLSKCVAPIDFTSATHEFRDELEQKYGLDLKRENKFFFYTSATEPYLTDNNLMKIRARKIDATSQQTDGNQSATLQFDFKFTFKHNELNFEHEIKGYELRDLNKDRYQIVVPYLLADWKSSHNLAKLDASDFTKNSENHRVLQTELMRILPHSISFSSSLTVAQPKSSLLSRVRDLFSLSQGDVINQSNYLIVDYAVLQPLKHLDHHILAVYSVPRRADEVEQPNFKIFTDIQSHSSSIRDFFNAFERERNEKSNFLTLETVIIGPREDRID